MRQQVAHTLAFHLISGVCGVSEVKEWCELSDELCNEYKNEQNDCNKVSRPLGLVVDVKELLLTG